MLMLRANTAVDVLIGPFLDSTDGDTEETGLTISQSDVLLSKNGQALTQKNDDTAASHDANGMYNCELDATDTNTEGQLVLKVHVSGALYVRHEFNVLSEAAWDSLFVAKDDGYMDVNIKAISEDTTAADNLESACDNYSVTRGLAGTALPAAAADAAGGLPISDAGGLDIDTILGRITDARMQVLTDWINGGRLDLILDTIAGDVVNIDGAAMRGTDNAALAATALTNTTWTDVRAAYLDAAISSRGTADPGDEMNLADDAITSAKYDELTAFPQTGDSYVIVSHADYGNAQLVRSATPANELNVDSNGRVEVANIAIGSSGISTIAESATISTGSQVNTYTSSHERDGTYHELSDSGGTLDAYYQFDVGATGIPSAVTIYGRATGLNDPVDIYGYNWGTTSWEQIGTLPGENSDAEYTMSMLSSHVGSDANAGKVRLRFYATGLTSSTLYLDQVYVSYAVVQSSVGYALGSIWVDTNNGYSGSVTDVNGVADYPVDNWADALTLSAASNLFNFQFAPGSSITLTGASDSYSFIGNASTVVLNGQSISGSYFKNMSISGNDDGSNTIPARYENCSISNNTLGQFRMNQCPLGGTITIAEAGTYILDQCFSITSTNAIDFGAAVGDTNVAFRHFAGDIEIRNLGQSGTDEIRVAGTGRVIINANCTGGTVYISGNMTKVDNSGGAVSVYEEARYDVYQVNAEADTALADFFTSSAQLVDDIWDELLTGGTHNIATSAGRRLRDIASSVITTGTAVSATANTITLNGDASSSDGAYDPACISIVGGTGYGQSRLIFDYVGATKTATVDRNWKTNPDATSEYVITANPGREHINEGLAQAGAANSITLNAFASSADDAYNRQIVFIRSGTGEDQVNLITDYNGTTKVATVSATWTVTPDATSGYVILPTYVNTSDDIDSAITSNVNVVAIKATTDKLDDTLEDDGGTYRFTENALDTILSAETETGLELKQAIQIITALAMKASGGGTSTISFRNYGDSKNRLVMTVDEDGNRSNVTVSLD